MMTYCNLCNLWLNSPDQLTAHQSGRAHKRRETFGMAITGQPVAFACLPGNEVMVTSQNNNQLIERCGNLKQNGPTEQNGASKLETSKNEEYFCNICLVSLTSKIQANMHYRGSKHKKVLEVIAGKTEGKECDGGNKVMEDVCELCNVPLPSKVIADAHYAGTKHEKKLKMSQSLCGIPSPSHNGGVSQATTATQSLSAPVPTASLQFQISQLSSSVHIPTSSGSQISKTKAVNVMFCNLCKISVNSLHQMDAHQNGMKHKNTVKGIATQPKNSCAPRPVYYHGRFISQDQHYSHENYGSVNGVAGHRSRHPVGYVPHQF